MIKKFKILKKGFNMKKLTKKLLASLMAVVMVSGISIYAQGDLTDVNSDECLNVSNYVCTHNVKSKSVTITNKQMITRHAFNTDSGSLDYCNVMDVTYKYVYTCASCRVYLYTINETIREHSNPNCPG